MFRLLLLISVILAVVGTSGYYIWQFWNTPQRQLLRQFDKLRGLILSDVEEDRYREVENLLTKCEAHLRSLLKTHEKLEALSEMSDTAQQIQPGTLDIELETFEDQLDQDLEHFFDELTRISTHADLSRESTLAELKEFTREIETRRSAFLELAEHPENAS
jgi:hypothetical protein